MLCLAKVSGEEMLQSFSLGLVQTKRIVKHFQTKLHLIAMLKSKPETEELNTKPEKIQSEHLYKQQMNKSQLSSQTVEQWSLYSVKDHIQSSSYQVLRPRRPRQTAFKNICLLILAYASYCF